MPRPLPIQALDRNLGWLDRIVGAPRRNDDFIARLPPLRMDSPLERMLRHLATQPTGPLAS